jgi:transposase
VDLKRKKNQLGKFLLRSGKTRPFLTNPWTVKHRQWLDTLKFEQPAQQIVLQDYIHALDCADARLKLLTQMLEEAGRTTVHAPIVAALRALKGVDYVTAVTLVAEIGDISRFSNPAQLMAYAGIIPSEHSSGLRHRRGSITKTGNKHVRRVVIEAAWHYRRQPKVSVKLKKRQEGVSGPVKEISWKAQNRLNSKFRKMMARGKPSQKAVVAVARELLGFIWSIANQVVNEELSKAA